MRLALALVALSAAAAAAPIPPGAFVRVEGDHFSASGERFEFIGANVAAVQGGLNRARYQETILAMERDGLTVGRIWAFGEGPADASEWMRRDQLFRAGPDGWIEESFVQLDRVIAFARAHGVRLIVTLSNNWSDYGGIPEYLRWAGLPDDDVVDFYRDERVRALYEAHLDKLLSRVNTVDGTRYVDDPAILSWELINESIANTPDVAAARRDWIRAMARRIKARDPNHLVAAGVEGYASRAERAEWVRVHEIPEVDYCDAHLYPQPDGVRSWKRLVDLVDDRAQLARFVIGKPLVIGEFGFRTDQRRGFLGRARPRLFRDLLERLLRDGVSGALVWIYQPWPRFARDFGIYTDRRDTDDVRRAMSTAARAVGDWLGRPNPRLGVAAGEGPLYDPFVTLRGSSVHARWQRSDGKRRMEIDPRKFALARFERTGHWEQGTFEHVYGVGAGRFEYRFVAPGGRAPSEVRVRARMSSEWPGASGPEGGGSEVVVRIDGREVARLAAPTDDGVGGIEEAVVRDRQLLGKLAAGAHTLTFEVPDAAASEVSNGLCLYGAPTGRYPTDNIEATPIVVEYAAARVPQDATRRASSSGDTDRKPRHSDEITGR